MKGRGGVFTSIAATIAVVVLVGYCCGALLLAVDKHAATSPQRVALQQIMEQ
jgi:hypothetical protein